MKLIAAAALVAIAATSAQAANMYEYHYEAAVEAHSDCLSAWFDSSRKEAIEQISQRGDGMVAVANPLRDDPEMLGHVVEMMNECSLLIYPGNPPQQPLQ